MLRRASTNAVTETSVERTSELSAVVEEELFRIFSFYTLYYGDPTQPQFLKATAFLKFAVDCDLKLPQEELEVIFAHAHKKNKQCRKTATGCLTYNNFLNILLAVAVRVYPHSMSKDIALQQLLSQNILPFAKRRQSQPVKYTQDLATLLKEFNAALRKLFHFYSEMTANRLLQQAARENRGKKPVAIGELNKLLGYAEFIKFSLDFEVTSVATSIEIGDVFLSSCSSHLGVGGEERIPMLKYREFVEALARVALTCKAIGRLQVGTADKFKGLLLNMWRALSENPRLTEAHHIIDYRSKLSQEAKLFDRRFRHKWEADGFRNYLSAPSSSPSPRIRPKNRQKEVAKARKQMEGIIVPPSLLASSSSSSSSLSPSVNSTPASQPMFSFSERHNVSKHNAISPVAF